MPRLRSWEETVEEAVALIFCRGSGSSWTDLKDDITKEDPIAFIASE